MTGTVAVVLAAGLGAVLIPVVLVMLQLQAVVPRSVLILYPVVLIFLMAGARFAYRIWKEHRLYSPLAALGEPVLVIGAGALLLYNALPFLALF